MPSEGLAAVIELLRSAPRDRSADVTERRAGMDALAQSVTMPEDVTVEAVDVAGVPAERVAAPGVSSDRWLLYLHGGAYIAGSLNSHRALVARLSRTVGCTALNVDYRLAPEHPFPAAVDDALTAFRWLSERVAPGAIAVGGDSAGGGLAAALLVAIRDAGIELPAAGVLISPWTDLTMTAGTYATRAEADPMISREPLAADARLYLAGADPRSPLASPLYADLSGLPPLLLQVGDAECLLDDSVSLAAKARAAGVDCTLEVTPEAIHVWHAFAEFAPEGAAAVDRLAAWLRPHLGL
ncbi:MAG: alpha/beta hydrolase [Actinomycetota bacterium]|nr:alpha/beta hydrolase [Actinomycetota bacterium]